ncbi:hypothetical protein DFH09DRAFT_1472612, partial [Mycena vulgaris]
MALTSMGEPSTTFPATCRRSSNRMLSTSAHPPANAWWKDPPDILPSTTSSIGPIRQERLRKNRNGAPYSRRERNHRDPERGLEASHWDRGSPRDISASHNPAPSTIQSLRDSLHPPNVQRMVTADNYPPIVGGPGSKISTGHGSTTFNSVRGDMTQLNVNSFGESGINMLQRYVVMEALHDSGERFSEPACHPGTRINVLQELREWSVDTKPASTILWVHGSAGAGKSAIAQMFAGDCQAQGRLGGSFFFRRGHPKRGTWHGLFTTIAYQLARSIPEFMPHLQDVMDRDPLVVGRAMAVQFQRLLVEPFGRMAELQFLPVVVIDGLDECADHQVQQQILRLFIGAMSAQRVPLRILISSRPELPLREILETPETFSACRHFALAADASAYDDIRTYLRDEFNRMYSEYKSRGINLGAGWPSEDALEHLVTASSGTFIHASTVIRFIDDQYSHPVDQLDSVLRLDPRSTAPLDDLYTQILSVIPQEPKQLRVLHAVCTRTLSPDLGMDPEDIDILLSLRAGTCRLVLRGLHSLFYVPPVR